MGCASSDFAMMRLRVDEAADLAEARVLALRTLRLDMVGASLHRCGKGTRKHTTAVALDCCGARCDCARPGGGWPSTANEKHDANIGAGKMKTNHMSTPE